VTARAALLVAVVAFGVPGSTSAQPPQGIVRPDHEDRLGLRELGEQLYAGNCSSCHGIAGQGLTSRAPKRGAGAIKAYGPSLRGVGALAADFYLRTGYMPLGSPDEQPQRSRPQLSEREIRALVDYVDSLGDGPPVPDPDPETGSLAEGLRLFTEHCAGCHQVVAQGGIAPGARVPPLEDSTPTQIAEAVRIGPYVMPRFSEKDISDTELNSIVRYVQYAKHPNDRGGWGIGNLGPIPEGMVTWFAAASFFLAFCMVIGQRLRS